jgi:tRNA-specific 2-thiouridylase
VSLLDDTTVRVDWAEPQRRVAPGQSVVLYAGDEVVGGGVVRR